MARVEFYALWSLQDPPRQLVSKGGRMSFQLPLPLPLPKQLVLFSLGDWSYYTRDTCVMAQLITGDAEPQHLGTLSANCRSLVWDGKWNGEIVMESEQMVAQGIPAKLFLTATGQVLKGSGFRSSTPARKRPCALRSPLLSESAIAHVRPPDIPMEVSGKLSLFDKGQSSEVTQLVAGVILKDSPPAKVAVLDILPQSKETGADGQEKKRRLSWKVRIPRKLLFSSSRSDEGNTTTVSPSPRWGHSAILCDPETVILIGGEGPNQQPCQDSLWKMEMESDFWISMDSLCSGPSPQCSRGHTATFDPETKRLYVYGGIREDRRFSSIYVLDTCDWKWTLLTAGGKVPTLSHHSATMYQRELYVFGGLCPLPGSDSGSCTNSLYIFNPEYKIWYQPIAEGERPLPRFGHTATLLGNRVVIFGGRRSPSPVYLNDLCILDLGYMEFMPVPATGNKPSPRCFHAAVRVDDNKLLIHGGCSTQGSLKDAFIFNIDTSSWSTIKFGDALQPPRAGHMLLNLNSSSLTDSDKEKRRVRGLSSIFLIGGSDGAGNFYSDKVKIQLTLP
ncbi:uncharacterized protein O3C94_011759 [Discoglossus pictus]